MMQERYTFGRGMRRKRLEKPMLVEAVCLWDEKRNALLSYAEKEYAVERLQYVSGDKRHVGSRSPSARLKMHAPMHADD